jgi:hypothetical protein
LSRIAQPLAQLLSWLYALLLTCALISVTMKIGFASGNTTKSQGTVLLRLRGCLGARPGFGRWRPCSNVTIGEKAPDPHRVYLIENCPGFRAKNSKPSCSSPATTKRKTPAGMRGAL